LNITPTSDTIVWDSKTGLVTNNDVPIKYTGTSYGTIGTLDENTGEIGKISISFVLKSGGTATFTRKKLYY
jgi:hypothetical protein